MPESKPEVAAARCPGELNDPQRRRLSVTCIHIDNLLCAMEHALHSASSPSPFPRYVVDITPAQAQEIEERIKHLRSQLLRALDWQHMKPEPAEIPLTRSVLTDLAFVDIAIEELKPRYMRGCGAIPEDAADGLNEVVGELGAAARAIARYLRQEMETARERSTQKPEKLGDHLQ